MGNYTSGLCSQERWTHGCLGSDAARLCGCCCCCSNGDKRVHPNNVIEHPAISPATAPVAGLITHPGAPARGVINNGPTPSAHPPVQQAPASKGPGKKLLDLLRQGLPTALEGIKQIGSLLPFPGKQACNLLAVVLQRMEDTAKNNENVKDLGERAVAFLDILHAYSSRLDQRNPLPTNIFTEAVEKFQTILEEIRAYAEQFDKKNVLRRFTNAGGDKSMYENLVLKLQRLQTNLDFATTLDTNATLKDIYAFLLQAPVYKDPYIKANEVLSEAAMSLEEVLRNPEWRPKFMAALDPVTRAMFLEVRLAIEEAADMHYQDDSFRMIKQPDLRGFWRSAFSEHTKSKSWDEFFQKFPQHILDDHVRSQLNQLIDTDSKRGHLRGYIEFNAGSVTKDFYAGSVSVCHLRDVFRPDPLPSQVKQILDGIPVWCPTYRGRGEDKASFRRLLETTVGVHLTAPEGYGRKPFLADICSQFTEFLVIYADLAYASSAPEVLFRAMTGMNYPLETTKELQNVLHTKGAEQACQVFASRMQESRTIGVPSALGPVCEATATEDKITQKPVLLIFDNADHALRHPEANACLVALIRTLTKEVPGVKVVASSTRNNQESAAASGSQPLESGSSLDSVLSEYTLGPLNPESAIGLVRDITETLVDFKQAESMATACGRIPLAITLAAQALVTGQVTVEDVVKTLRQEPVVTQSDTVGQHTIVDTIAKLVLCGLEPKHQQVAAQLAVLPSYFNTSTAAGILEMSTTGAVGFITSELWTLERHHILQPWRCQGFFVMHEVVRREARKLHPQLYAEAESRFKQYMIDSVCAPAAAEAEKNDADSWRRARTALHDHSVNLAKLCTILVPESKPAATPDTPDPSAAGSGTLAGVAGVANVASCLSFFGRQTEAQKLRSQALGAHTKVHQAIHGNGERGSRIAYGPVEPSLAGPDGAEGGNDGLEKIDVENTEENLVKAIYADMKSRGHMASALGPPELCSSGACVGLHDLPDCLQDLHYNMPTSIKEAPVTLLKIEQVLAWKVLKVFEEVDTRSEALKMPYEDIDDALWEKVITVSWRWSEPKPASFKEGFSPMSYNQFLELKELLQNAVEKGLKLVWIDWSCVPQYSGDYMLEVHRSKVFYARAHGFCVVPTFQQLPTKGHGRGILAKTRLALMKQSEGDICCEIAAEIIQSILEKDQIASRDYFCRVWTRAERMARHGRSEGLSNWLSLESWLGMLIDALLKSTEDPAPSQIYKKMLGWKAAELLDEILGPLQAAVDIDIQASGADGLAIKIANLCQAAVNVWLSPSQFAEAPTLDWLHTYLVEEALSGVYQAWDEADRVWAIYSFFCMRDSVDPRSTDGLLIALTNLVRETGRNGREYMGIYAKLRRNVYQHLLSSEMLEDLSAALYVAERDGDTEQVRALLDAEADTDALDKGGLTLLIHASMGGHTAVVKSLLEAGADKDAQDWDGLTALMQASLEGHTEVIKILLAAGADKEVQDKDGWTALMHASSNGHTEVVKTLLAARANMEVQNEDGWTALMRASSQGHTEVVKILLAAGAYKGIRDKNEWTALMHASVSGRTEVVKTLLAAGAIMEVQDKDGLTPLIHASLGGHTAVVKSLLEAGADKDAQNQDGCNALIRVSYEGHTEMVAILLAAGANKEVQDKFGWTALMTASSKGHTEVVKILLAAGANKEVQDKNGNTALMRASQEGHTKVVKILLAAGADKEAQDKDGWTALMAASSEGRIEVVKILLAAGADKEAQDKSGYTALMGASSKGHTEVVRTLLSAGANKEVQDKDGWTALMRASSEGHIGVVEILLATGANNEVQDKFGWTALMRASSNGHTEVVETLLAAGATMEVQDKEGEPALDFARQKGHDEVVDLLQARQQ